MFQAKLLQSERFYICLIVAAAFLITLPILIWGVPYGYDMPHHYQCALTYLDAIQSGNFYPSWTLDRNLGYGALELRMYPPISHYVLALFGLITGNWHLATWLTYLFWWILGGCGVYLLAREYVEPRAALFAALLFGVMPYRLSQLYLTFLYSELSAIAVLPFCFYFLTCILKEKNETHETSTLNKNYFLSLNILGLAVSYAALILTHLPMTVIGTLSLGIYFFAQVQWNFKSLRCAVLKTACGLSLGLVATSFFWTKVLQERFLMAKNDIYEEIYVFYQYNFLLTWLQKYDDVSINVADNTIVYDVILYLTLLTILPIAFLKIFSRTEAKNHLWRGLWITLSVSIFLTTILSRPLWDNLPLLNQVQFSWRWLGVVSILAPIVASSGFSILCDWFRDAGRRPFALIILGTVFIGLSFPISQSVRGAVYKSPAEMNSYVQEAGQKDGFTFWWTIWARKDFVSEKVNKVAAGSRRVNIQEWKPTERVFTVEGGQPSDVYVATFYHPNWHATVNGDSTEIRPADDGGINLPVPEEKAIIKLSFKESVLVIWAQVLSLIVWLLILSWGVFWLIKIYLSAKKSNPQYSLISGRFYTYIYKIHKFSSTKYGWLLLVFFSIFSLLPFIFVGIYNGGDLLYHAQVAGTFEEGISYGNFYPSWSGTENLGYGSLIVRIYPPLTGFLNGLFHILFGNWHTAICATFLFFTLLGSFGVYLWAKEFISPPKAIWAGVAFTLMPYHLHEIYSSSMYAEFAGCCVIPFSLLFITRICRNGNVLNVLGLAISYAALILTHLPLTVFGSLMLALYGVILLFQTKEWGRIIKLAVGVIFGLMASSMYWVRMATEKDLVRMAKFVSYSEHFQYYHQFLFNFSSSFNSELLNFSLLAFSLLVMISGALFSLYSFNFKNVRSGFIAVIIVFFVSIFMTIPLSKPIWMIMPFLQEVQFPWRFLTVSSVCASVLLVAGIESFWKLSYYSQKWKKDLLGYLVIVFLCFSYFWLFIGTEYFKGLLVPNEFNSLVAKETKSLGFEFAWTNETKETAFDIKEKVIANGREITIVSWEPTERTFSVEAGSVTQARIATLFYPHWKATVNNDVVEPIPADDGAMVISIPNEKSTVKIWFQEPSYIILAKYVSILTWLFFGLTGLFYVFSKGKMLNFKR